MAVCRPRGEASEGANSADTLILDFPPLKLRHKCLLLSHPDHGALSWQPGKWARVASNGFQTQRPFFK